MSRRYRFRGFRCSIPRPFRCMSFSRRRSCSLILIGKSQFSDVNAFLTLAATRHTLLPDDLRVNPRADKILTAARAGKVPVHLVSSKLIRAPCVRAFFSPIPCLDMSEKNPLITLPHDAIIISLLELFARGSHRGTLVIVIGTIFFLIASSLDSDKRINGRILGDCI